MKRNAWIAIFPFCLAACSGSNYNFSPIEATNENIQKNPSNPDQPLPSCSEQLRTLSVPIKVLFVVDKSGSNVQGDFGTPPTDPDKSMRGGSIQKFLNEYGAKPNFSWAFLTFNDNTLNSLTGSGGNVFGSAMIMQNAINQFMATTDSGNTPYQVALQGGQGAIAGDSSKTSQTKYIVVFVSDGMPNPAISQSDVLGHVQAILNSAPQQTTFNSIFYGTGQPAAGELMRAMAATGLGSFLDANLSPTRILNIGDLVRVPGVSCEN